MTQLIRETASAFRGIILGAYVVALAFCGAGIWLVYLGATPCSRGLLAETHEPNTIAR